MQEYLELAQQAEQVVHLTQIKIQPLVAVQIQILKPMPMLTPMLMQATKQSKKQQFLVA